MSKIAVNEKNVVVTKGLFIDIYDHVNHKITHLNTPNLQEDEITDVAISSNDQYLAVITSASKKLLIYNLPTVKEEKVISLPRSASKIRFTANNTQILVADKTGDVLIYNILADDNGTKLLGHLSLLLNILQTNDGKFIITSDRDEKIRVTCYPNTYNIQTYCLGHKEYVNNIELLPHNEKYVISTSGDGTIKCWNYKEGTLCYNINVNLYVNDEKVKDEFKKSMKEEGLEVDCLPVTNFAIMKSNDNTSIIAVTLHLVKKIFFYTIENEHDQFNHKLLQTLALDEFPCAIQFYKSTLYVYFDTKCEIFVYNIAITDQINVHFTRKLSMFIDTDTSTILRKGNAINVLFKRKFDNVQEYKERKKKRLGITD